MSTVSPIKVNDTLCSLPTSPSTVGPALVRARATPQCKWSAGPNSPISAAQFRSESAPSVAPDAADR